MDTETGVLSDKQIVREYIKENIVITDFCDENLGNCSYDVTLGNYYYMCTLPSDSIYNPYSEDSAKMWRLYQARTIHSNDIAAISSVSSSYSTNPPSSSSASSSSLESPSSSCVSTCGIKDTDLVIWLYPRATILAHTNEFIGGRNYITTMMKARSSIGRSFLEVCSCSGWGDIGYINRWTMEIRNNSDYYIPLLVGSRVAQIVFFYTGDCLTSYENKKNAKYQSSFSSIQEMKDAWKPEHMLPRLYLDVIKKDIGIKDYTTVSSILSMCSEKERSKGVVNDKSEDRVDTCDSKQNEVDTGKEEKEKSSIVSYVFEVSLYTQSYRNRFHKTQFQCVVEEFDSERNRKIYARELIELYVNLSESEYCTSKYHIFINDVYFDVEGKKILIKVRGLKEGDEDTFGDEFKCIFDKFSIRKNDEFDKDVMDEYRIRVKSYHHSRL